MMSDVGKQLDAIATKFYELDLHNKSTAAQVDFQNDLKEIENKYEKDTDFSTIEARVQKDVNDSIAKRLEYIPKSQKRMDTQASFEASGMNFASKVRSQTRSRHIANTKALEDMAGQTYREKYIVSDEAGRTEALALAIGLIDNSVAAGVYTPEVGAAMKLNLPVEFEKARAEFDAVTNPDMFLKDMDSYALSAKSREEVKEKAILKKEKNKKQSEIAEKENNIANELNLITAMTKGEIDETFVTNVNDMMDRGEISQEFGQAFMMAQFADTETFTDSKKYSKKTGFYNYVSSLFENDSLMSRHQGYINVLNLAADKKINKQELHMMLAAAMNDAEPEKKESWNILSFIGDLFSGGKLWSKDEAAYEFTKELRDGKSSQEALKKILEKNKNVMNPQFQSFEVGQIYSFPLGSIKVLGTDVDGMLTVENLNGK